jgi:hypothetical protein
MIANYIILTEQSEPATPPANYTIVYLDEVDGEIKAKNSEGNIEILK